MAGNEKRVMKDKGQQRWARGHKVAPKDLMGPFEKSDNFQMWRIYKNKGLHNDIFLLLLLS